MSEKRVVVALVGNFAGALVRASESLTKGMYGSEFRPAKDVPFGLCCGQMRANEFTHNSGWYNSKGEKLGWGDLSIQDMQRIARELPSGEVFYILGEYDSYWNVKRNSPHADPEAPGIAYCREYARFIITGGHVYRVDDIGSQERGTRDYHGLTITFIHPDDVSGVTGGAG